MPPEACTYTATTCKHRPLTVDAFASTVRPAMSSGGVFFVVLAGLVALTLFWGWLYVKWQVEHGEPWRERQAAEEFGPLFDLEPSKGHVTLDRSAQRFRYTTDWNEVRKQAGR